MTCAMRKSSTTVQISQRGTSLNSCQKWRFSFFRRKRISRILSFNEPFIPCGSSVIDSSFTCHIYVLAFTCDRRARLVLLPVPIGPAATAHVGHQQNESD